MVVKEELHAILETLNEDATWDDVIYEIHVRRKISEGLKAVEQGQTVSHEDVKRMFAG